MQDVALDQQPYLDQVVSTLRDDLGPELVGVYLHGSVAMGAFIPGRSDIDALAVCAVRLSAERSTTLGEALAAIPRPSSGGDLEFTLVAEKEVRAHSAAPAYEIHVRTHDEPFVVDGHDDEGDENLVIDFAMARARGRSLFGPDPAGMFPEPDRAALIRAFRGELEMARRMGASWWESHDLPESASMTYQVLNGARSLRYLDTGELGSKAEGAAWLERHDSNPDVHALLAAALTYQRGGAPTQPDQRVVDAFMDRVEAELRAAEV